MIARTMMAPDDEGHGTGPRAYNSVWQVRADSWSGLADVAKRMIAEPGDDPAREELLALAGTLDLLESFWAYPGVARVAELRDRVLDGDATAVAELGEIAGVVVGDRQAAVPPTATAEEGWQGPRRPAFEVLVLGDTSTDDAEAIRAEWRSLRRPEDAFTYELVFVASLEDALAAVLLNFDLQACIVRPGFAVASLLDLRRLRHLVAGYDAADAPTEPVEAALRDAGDRFHELRPELDLYVVGHARVETIAGALGRRYRRVFQGRDTLELHLSILRGVGERYETPFFSALRSFSQRPTGVFHALPISRGNSVVNSPWIHDMADFYGLNVFLAETSATSGGLDSLLEPAGPIKRAQTLAARAFGADHTFFVTNGTSTANKIVVQSIVAPGDIVLVDRNCHKSHHYALMMAGAQVAYLEAYPVHRHAIYGAVPLASIKRLLLRYRAEGRLDSVKMLMLTNCTFDGIVYDVERVMEECLAIKPDLVFLWDEAWFAFAGFHPTYRRRTAMAAARRIEARLRTTEATVRHADAVAALEGADDEALVEARLVPDPTRVRLRVYATQSTHKTLTALRQGSMIHVRDQDFSKRNEEAFHEAYMTHTSTSPNYQILASLDVGRRQVELEGFELVQKQVELAMVLREAVAEHPRLAELFRFLTTTDLIPPDYRRSGIERPLTAGLSLMDRAWRRDEFVLDPSRLTLDVGATGIDGDTFKTTHLMARHGIQVNKTSRNTVLFMTNIGTTRSAVAYLIGVLSNITDELTEGIARMGPVERRLHAARVAALTGDPPPMPDFSSFHRAFRRHAEATTPEGDLRKAFFTTYDDALCEYLVHDEVLERLETGGEVVSAMFVTPYPPGFPVLVPGQVISTDILEYLQRLDTPEIHGYQTEIGFRVFTAAALDS
jgi:arginine decarboxylase